MMDTYEVTLSVPLKVRVRSVDSHDAAIDTAIGEVRDWLSRQNALTSEFSIHPLGSSRVSDG